jgi:hypothetical protein
VPLYQLWWFVAFGDVVVVESAFRPFGFRGVVRAGVSAFGQDHPTLIRRFDGEWGDYLADNLAVSARLSDSCVTSTYSVGDVQTTGPTVNFLGYLSGTDHE